jgi:alkanesulfonate monooxygenase SsuD/methylene tetrahydromethanopterin reductase-like flavin-dependent oxidoreductase (luciferase family)
MDIGFYFDLRNPPEWPADSSQLYGSTLEMCEEAERLGAASIWVTEHHLFEDGYLTQPLTFLAAVAARTRRVRIGTAVLLAPLRSAVQIAEEAAVVDILSNGRLELGLGAGYRVPEFELFGADFNSRFKTADASAERLRQIWAQGRITPHPIQRPIPIWMGYQTPEGARRAGRMGLGLLSPAGALWGPYREGLTEGGHDPALGRMGGVIAGWISEDPEGDWPTVSKHLAYQISSYNRYEVEGTGRPPRAVDVERLRWRGGALTPNTFLLATPEQAARQILAYCDGAPVKHVYFFPSIAGMPVEMAMKHIRTICSKLAPLLKGAM